MPPTHCAWCGQPLADSEHADCGRGRELDPPRHCNRCGGRLDVQVFPTGVTATCRRCDGIHPARRPGRGTGPA